MRTAPLPLLNFERKLFVASSKNLLMLLLRAIGCCARPGGARLVSLAVQSRGMPQTQPFSFMVGMDAHGIMCEEIITGFISPTLSRDRVASLSSQRRFGSTRCSRRCDMLPAAGLVPEAEARAAWWWRGSW